MRLNFHSEPASLDPRLVRDIPTITVGKMLFDGLLRFTETGPVCSLARSFEKKDKRYTFYLRECHWTNGAPITAFDFEYAWKKVLSPCFPSEFANQLFIIKGGEAAKKGLLSLCDVGVWAEDSHTLVVELEYDHPHFLQLVSQPICYPIPLETELIDPSWADRQGEEFVCSGPFCLAYWNHGNELALRKNFLYWDSKVVKLEHIIVSMIEDEHTELNMYESGELDWAGSPNSSIPPEALPSLKPRGDLYIAPIAGTFCYKFNIEKPPFHSLKMRRAFALAINRKALVDNILQGNQMVAQSLVPPCMRDQFAFPFLKDKEGNQTLALKLFEEALEEEGWTRETLPPITLIFSKSEKTQKTAQAVQQDWNQTFGIQVSLQSYEWNVFIDRLAKRNYQVGGRGFVSDLNDPKTLLDLYRFRNGDLGGNNDTGWEKEEYIALLQEAEHSLEQREHLLNLAERLLLEEMPIVPLYHSTACYLKKDYVKGVYLSELCDLDFKRAFIVK